MGEYITPTEVDELDLPAFHWRANRQKIGELAAQLKEGKPELAERNPKNRLGLRLLANARKILDNIDAIKQEQAETLRYSQEVVERLGLRDDPNQLAIEFETTGEE